RGSQVSPTPDSTLADPQQIIGDLRRELAECRAELAGCRAERDEALAQQTATAEVLEVINSSPGDLDPVFDTILEKAHDLCGATQGVLVIRAGEEFRLAAAHGEPGFVEAMWALGPPSPRPAEGSLSARLMLGERVIHIADAGTDDSYRKLPLQVQ